MQFQGFVLCPFYRSQPLRAGLEVLAGERSHCYTSDNRAPLSRTVVLSHRRRTLGGARGAVRQKGTPAAGQTSQTSPGHQRGDSCLSRVALTPSGHSLSSDMCSNIRGATEAAPEWRLQVQAPDGRGPASRGPRRRGSSGPPALSQLSPRIQV